MIVVHIAIPQCFEIIFRRRLAARTCRNISFKNVFEFGGQANEGW
ncbi:hypothetical protein AZE42_11112 [Rhizopogon vesiculosus]|uniref:Uncharacterized protein n=1 Tax=Rhizopogon vesiculosus TaxID=180088 RepID=A0A1J8PVJ0_9AGAM|nr:hypothetical protein AZE42_11112 [Rhizopogon vesiculosus]